jgi:formyltetrahydrofolate deformylase
LIVSDGNAPSSTLVALLHGPDRPGLVAGVAGWIFEHGGNIVHADQHDDATYGVFFQRVEWLTPSDDPLSEAAAFAQFARTELGMAVRASLTTYRPRVLIFVSKHLHACHELLLDWRQGDLPCQVVAIVSNHLEAATTAAAYDLPFHHFPVEAESRPGVELRQLELLRELHADLVVLARYMQVLSTGFLAQAGCPIINIHHSFLPAFAGARPYHQAHRRGVKLIGATAHYVTPALDDGPIIHQEVRPVSHRDAVGDLLRKGRDLEKLVLSEAVRLHLENRVLVYENKTVVFD